MLRHAAVVTALLLVTACGGDDDTEADRLGVGAQCASTDQCDVDIDLVCLDQFKGGYCGLVGCEADIDCPEGSACVLHDDGETYCFRICLDKAECNQNRDLENEANCSSSIDFIEAEGIKACVPPSGS
jgi:hypothetical protein